MARVDITGLTSVLEELGAAAETPGAEIMTLAGEVLVDGVLEEFETEGGGRWPQLADSTLRKRRGSTAQILVDTNRMRGSINADKAIAAGDDSVTVSTDVEYAIFHVSKRARTKIPLRDFFDIQPKYFEDAIEVVLDGILAKSGFGGSGAASAPSG